MNKGIKMAKGRYLLFLNSGDYFTTNEVLHKTEIKLWSSDIVVASCNYVQDGKIIYTTKAVLNPTLHFLCILLCHISLLLFLKDYLKNMDSIEKI